MANQRAIEKKPKKLAIFLATAFSILGVAVLLVTSILEIYFNFKIQQKVVINQQNIIAKNAANEVKVFINNKFNLLESAVKFGNLTNTEPDKIKLVLDKMLGSEASFRRISFFDLNKQELSSTTRESLNQPDLEQTSENLFSQMKEDENYISPVYVDQLTGEPIVMIAIPVKDVLGNKKGVLAAETNLKFMWDLVSGLKVGKNGVAYVVDEKGKLLSYYDISRVLKGENISQVYEVYEFMNNLDSEGGEAEIARGIGGKYVVSNYVALGVPRWAIIVELPLIEAYAPLIEILKSSAALMFIVILSTIIVGILISKRIAKPIVILKNAAKGISEGKLLETKININSNDEIGELAEAFNSMARKLGGFYKELEKKVAERTYELAKRMEEIEISNEKLEKSKTVMLSLAEDAQESEKKAEKEKNKYEIERDRSQGILRYLHAIGEGVIATDIHGIITFVNLAAARMILKEEGSTLIGKKYSDLFRFTSGRGIDKKSINPVDLTLESNKVFILPQICYLHNDVKAIPVSGSFAPIFKNNQVLGVVSVFQDITERRNIEKEKDDFISIAAHQLRTPLTGIRWVLESLLDGDGGKISKEAKLMITEIFQNNQRLISLVNDLLDVSRINMGKLSEKPEPINICKIIQEAIDSLKGLAMERQIKILPEKKCPLNTKIKAGPKHIFHVLENLISNAIKYTPKGGKVVVSADFSEDKIVVSVKDTGIGIPKEDQDKIFTKFFRASNAVHKETDGSGLGLNVVKSFVEEEGGKIWFESAEGKGTTFFFELRAVKE